MAADAGLRGPRRSPAPRCAPDRSAPADDTASSPPAAAVRRHGRRCSARHGHSGSGRHGGSWTAPRHSCHGRSRSRSGFPFSAWLGCEVCWYSDRWHTAQLFADPGMVELGDLPTAADGVAQLAVQRDPRRRMVRGRWCSGTRSGGRPRSCRRRPGDRSSRSPNRSPDGTARRSAAGRRPHDPGRWCPGIPPDGSRSSCRRCPDD